MRIAVVGSGGREHALAARFASEGHEVVALPGNPGIESVGRCIAVNASDIPALTEACIAARPDLVVVGPEAPLAAGLADRLREKNVPVFGPSARASRIESSKAFAKEIMQRAGVPTAGFAVATTEAEAFAAIDRMQGRCAIKADGLASGKGVVVCSDAAEARDAAKTWLAKGPVVVEERLEGPEISVIAITDGKSISILPPARDHKRLRDCDEGPNTGGMGAVCPVPMKADELEMVRTKVIRPVLETLARDGIDFVGALYAGLMMTRSGAKVLEFNARFGDPETQAIMAALSPQVNLGLTLLDAAQGRLAEGTIPTSAAACAVVIASAGYPDAPRSGDAIEGFDEAERGGAKVLHAGTRREGGRIVSSGGRVLSVVATGRDLASARKAANEGAEKIRLSGAQWRRDIGAST